MTAHNVTAMRTKVQRWAETITETYGDSVAAIVAVGEQLKRAKADCSHGEWGELTGETTGKPMLPFSHRTARRLKAIANNAALSNRTHGPDLPASWRTLAILASLDPDDIEAAISDGDIHPDMQRKDAEALKARIDAPATPAPQPEPAPTTATVSPIEPRPDIPLNPDCSVDWEHVDPPMTDEQRQWVAESDQRIGAMIAEFAENQAKADRLADEIAEHLPVSGPDPRASGALGLDILATLGELARRIDRSGIRPSFIEPHLNEVRALIDLIQASLPETPE